MPMSKNKKILLMLAKGGATQSDIAAALHVTSATSPPAPR